MIENKKQLEVTRYWLERFKRDRDQLINSDDISEVMRDLTVRSYQSIIDELNCDIEVYEKNNP